MKNISSTCLTVLLMGLFGAHIAVSQSVTYTYDDLGRLTSVNYDQLTDITYTYDANDNLVNVATVDQTGTEAGDEIPYKFTLYDSYPNPFNPSATIRFEVERPVDVLLKLYNVLGQEIATLVQREYAPGRYQIVFDAGKMASGLYFYTIHMDSFSDTKSMVLIK